ncbi:MAG TPA: flavin reductase, partial [Noviherbaspirillum sp.]|nr:flavin reductase [Noviherbaspirillum sp.]
VLSVNVLAVDQEPLAKRFAGMSPGVAPETRFLAGQWKAGLSGAPVLEDALVSFDCQVIDVFPGSSHDMFLCSVINVSGREGDDRPLIYYNGMFGAFGECPTSI